MKILITGAAGFIGATLCHPLLERGDLIYAIDNLNDYYEVSLKQARLALLKKNKKFHFVKTDITDCEKMEKLFSENRFDVVVHLAAQAGVRYSIKHPGKYIDTNLTGFGHILEGCRHSRVEHLVYASSSSVYGSNTSLPCSENDSTEHPLSLYGATKKANELMAHTYSHLYKLPATALRFFTVYGPWGRPDMAFFKFTRMILAGEKIPVYNEGQMSRDFTFIDDIIDGLIRVIDVPAKPDLSFDPANPSCSSSMAPHCIYNIGSGVRIELLNYIQVLEEVLGRRAEYHMMPMQDGDVVSTKADISRLVKEFGYQPKTGIREGLIRFVEWYRDYYHI